jgi:opacity protein-like surface antigen
MKLSLIIATTAAAVAAAAVAAAAKTEIRFIAQALIETGRTFDGTLVGGLSGLDYLPW